MGKKVSALFDSQKFFGGLLIAMIFTGWTMNSQLGSIETKTNSAMTAIEKLEDSYLTTSNQMVALKTQNTFIIDEYALMKPIIVKTRQIQIGRTDEISCMSKMMDTLGCSIPRNHQPLTE